MIDGLRRIPLRRYEDERGWFCEDIGEENPVAIYIPGIHAHGFEALTDILFCYHVTVEYDSGDPDERTVAWNDPRVVSLWSTSTPILSARDAVES
jgi:dTDP-4-dehydrorhamnose 3,5-epimerase-like enzyme